MDAFHRSVATAISLSILLWKDSTPYTHFPNVAELVRIEIGRVLNHHMVRRECPWLVGRISPSLRTHLDAEPWDVEPVKLLSEFRDILKTDDELAIVGKTILECSYYDPTFEIIRRHGKPPTAKAEDIIRTARGVVKTLKLPEAMFEDVENHVRESYLTLYSQLRPAARH